MSAEINTSEGGGPAIAEAVENASLETRRPTLPALGSLLLLAVLTVGFLGAWLCQSAVHLRVGQVPPGADSYGLWPHIGSATVASLAQRASIAKPYLLFAVLFAAAAFVVGRLSPAKPGLRIMHIEPEEPPSPREPRTVRRRLVATLIAWAALAAAAVSLVFTIASARADLFVADPATLGSLDQKLFHFYAFWGLRARPVWWIPLLTYLLTPTFLGIAVAAFADAWGEVWSHRRWERLPAPSRILEWAAIAIICWGSTTSYLRGCETAPYVIQQDEGIVSKFGYFLTRPESQGTAEANIFHDPVQPNFAFFTRGVAIAFCGNSFVGPRYVSALTSGIGLIVVYLFLRGIVGGFAAVFTTFLVATSHIVIQYSRIGINNIDSMYWMFAMGWLFYAAETSRADTARLLRYLAAGFAGGMSFGMYTGTQLGVAAIAGMAILRLAAQIDLGRRRVAGIGLLFVGIGVGVAPFKANPLMEYGRSLGVYLLTADMLKHEFGKPEMKGENINTVEKLVAWHMKRSMLGYHGISDTSHDYTTPFPYVGPLLAALSALGGLVLLLRFRTWAAFFAWGLFIAGNLLGGALRHSPYAPSSARLILLMPSIALAAAVAVDAFVLEGARLAAAIGLDTRPRRIASQALVGVGLVAAVWLGGSEVRTNIALYRRFLTSGYLTFNYWMGASTELQRFIEGHSPKPEYIFQYDREVTANQSYWHNDFLLPHTEGHRYWIDPGQEIPEAQIPTNGQILFIFHNDRIEEMAAIKEQFPGGKTYHTKALPFKDAKPRYTLYEVFVGRTR